jgi:uncharacterized protein YjdB
MHVSPPRRWLAVLAALSSLTCAEQITAPQLAAIELTSDIGNRLAVGRTATITAVGRDASGLPLTGVVITWSSSANVFATVSQAGVVSGVAAGPATITATADGIAATLNFQVSTPDFAGITATLADPLFVSMTGGLSTNSRTRTQTALSLCTQGVTSGNFTTIESCVSGVRAEVTAAFEATDQALLATMALFIDHIDRLLKL